MNTRSSVIFIIKILNKIYYIIFIICPRTRHRKNVRNRNGGKWEKGTPTVLEVNKNEGRGE